MEQSLLANCVEQEQELQFEWFSREDALRLGLLLHANAEPLGAPVAIEITVNGLVVFRFFPEGAGLDNELWLTRKRRTVELMGMSSLRFAAWLESEGETMQDRKLDAAQYAAGGGGFPLALRGTGIIGSICVSGLPHLDDHQLIVDTLREWLGSSAAEG